MRAILEYVDHKSTEYETLPLFAFMRDPAVPPRDRLGFVPALAHFVMTFADLYAHVLREEPATDSFQELVNAHTYEDGGHWKWFLADLVTLGYDPVANTSQTVRLLWSPETLHTRLLSYRICRLGMGASSLEKLVLVQCIEAVGKISLTHAAPIGRALANELGKPLVYFGPHHLDTEADHTLEEAGVRSSLTSVEVSEQQSLALRSLIDETFAAFAAFSADLLTFAEAARSDRHARAV